MGILDSAHVINQIDSMLTTLPNISKCICLSLSSYSIRPSLQWVATLDLGLDPCLIAFDNSAAEGLLVCVVVFVEQRFVDWQEEHLPQSR